MAEQQLIDYITKARGASQSDDQTKSLLYKNGWTEAEVTEAFATLVQTQKQPQPKVEPPAVLEKVIEKPVEQPKVEPQKISETQIQADKFQLQPVASTNISSDAPTMKHQSHALMKFFIVLIILVVLGAVGYFFAGQYLSLPWNPFAASPETVVNRMFVSMSGVKSLHSVTQTEISAISNTTKVSQGKLNLNVESGIDITDIKSPKATSTVKVNLIPQGLTSPVASLDASVISIGSTGYLKMDNISIPNATSYPGLNISQINGKWFQVDKASYDAISQAENGQVFVANVASTDIVTKIKDLVLAGNIFSGAKQLNSEVIGGQETYHYSAIITNDKLKGLVSAIITSSTVNSFVSGAGDVNIEIWIGKKDYMLYQYKIDKVIDLSTSSLSMPVSLEVKIDSINSNFNQPVTVQTPAGAQKIEEVVLPILKIQKVALNLSQVTTEAESLFSTNNNYYLLCRSGFLNGSKTTPYGQVFISVANGVIKLGAKNPKCFAGSKSYCASTQLSDGTYLCVGSGSTTGTANCISAQTVCK